MIKGRYAKGLLVFLWLLALLGFPQSLCADIILLTNGNELQGTILSQEEGTVVVQIDTNIQVSLKPGNGCPIGLSGVPCRS